MFAKVVYSGLCAFGHALHKLLCCNVPLIGLAGSGVYPCFTYSSVGTADADVLVATAKTSLGVTFEMG